MTAAAVRPPAAPLSHAQRMKIAAEILDLITPKTGPRTAATIKAIAVRIGTRGGPLDRRGDSAPRRGAGNPPRTWSARLEQAKRAYAAPRAARDRVVADCLEAVRQHPALARWVHARDLRIVVLKKIPDYLNGCAAVGTFDSDTDTIVLDASQAKSECISTAFHEVSHAIVRNNPSTWAFAQDANGFDHVEEERVVQLLECHWMGCADAHEPGARELVAQVLAAAGVT